ncbi:MAG: amidohydrolase [Verrucomicrobiales bacterium]|nr:amidohydrolase [Verrucomicrobiales bacterium]
MSAQIDRIAPRLPVIRRHLHQHPELSGAELATTAYLAKQLSDAKIPYLLGAGKRGIITGTAPAANSPAPVIALRADIDALPIAEENQISYRSKNNGVMHACGHDAHSAILLGTTLALHRAGKLPVAWRSIFQPAEETGCGAGEMVARGAVKGLQAILALHVDPTLPAGHVSITPGPQSAFCQDFVIEVRGKGGHGARPHNTIDPIAVAAQLVTLIYQAVPRQTDARDPVVVTIGMIQGGQAPNIIPNAVVMKGTIRSFDQAVSDHARQNIQRLCAGTARAFRARIAPVFDRLLQGVINDPYVTDICLKAARGLLGQHRVVTDRRPSMGAEDFADYPVPKCMMLLGTRSPREKITPLHTGTFSLDERALLVGVRIFVQILLEWPSKHHDLAGCRRA